MLRYFFILDVYFENVNALHIIFQLPLLQFGSSLFKVTPSEKPRLLRLVSCHRPE